jgi:hypothetical protein
MRKAHEEIQKQYEVASDFLAGLCDIFFGGERNRMIIVPGNHDVSQYVSKASMSKIKKKNLTPFVDALWEEDSNIRWSWKDFHFYEIDKPDEYKNRFCDPSYSVTFNRKDYLNYARKAPDCDIYFWISWKQLKYRDITVNPLYGVWRADFGKMIECIENGQAPLHQYQHRTNDDHNAKDSYIFDLRDTDIMTKVYPILNRQQKETIYGN